MRKFASHAEVWTCQFEFQVKRLFLVVPQGCLQFVIEVFPDHTHFFRWKFYQELTVTMVQVPEGTEMSSQGQQYVQ